MPSKPDSSNPKAAFMAGLAWKIKIEWLGSCGIHELDKTRRVTIALRENGYADHYPGLALTLIHKLNGDITSQYLFFHDHIRPEDCSDGGNEHGRKQKLHIWGDAGAFDWYILRPKDREATRPFCKAAEDWIAAWR